MWNQQGCLAIGCGHMEMDGHALPSRCPHSQPAAPARPILLQDFDRWVSQGGAWHWGSWLVLLGPRQTRP